MSKIVRHVASRHLLQKTANLIPTRVLGKTGLRVTCFGLGGQALIEKKDRRKEACDLINKALDLGVNYFDTAPLYGPSREYLGLSLGSRRKDVIIASKVRERDYAGAKKELDESFDLLNTDYIDIVQLHAIEDQKDKRALKKDGAIKVLLEARQAGKIGFIGLTGHYDPEILSEFMDEFDFDTVLMAMNPAVPEFDSAMEKARLKNMGIISMKIMSRGILPAVYPSDLLLHYAMKKSDVAIVGCSTETDIEKNVLAAIDYNPALDIQFEVPEELKKYAAFFLKGFESRRWPDTYQPNIPDIQYE